MSRQRRGLLVPAAVSGAKAAPPRFAPRATLGIVEGVAAMIVNIALSVPLAKLAGKAVVAESCCSA